MSEPRAVARWINHSTLRLDPVATAPGSDTPSKGLAIFTRSALRTIPIYAFWGKAISGFKTVSISGRKKEVSCGY